jgi:GNAT superfamily N-acetyltransferase
MALTLQLVRNRRDLDDFIRFPWLVNHGDPYWVPPLLVNRRMRLDVNRNIFWRGTKRELWLAKREGRTVGTIAAFIHDRTLHPWEGQLGFFDCIDDPEVAGELLGAAEKWVRAQGKGILQGPYNPGPNDEPGVLVEGFDTRPAIMEGHNPRYYKALFERNGYRVRNVMVARLMTFPPGRRTIEEQMPERLRRVSERVLQRPDLRIRSFDPSHWEDEFFLACDIFNRALADVPDHIPTPWEDFRQTSEGLRSILWPELALIAEVDGTPVGYALALPDVNEALRPLNGRLGPLEMLRLWWGIRHLHRVSFKILMMLPEFQGRGIEAVLIREVGSAILKRGFREVDMSLTGETNEKSMRFQEHLGFKVYRRYNIYEKDLNA